MTYRIRDWEVFENPTRDKRPKKGMEWIHFPTSLTSRGRLRLLREGDRGAWAIVVFDSLLQLHSQRPISKRDGTLVNSDGSAIDIDDLSDSLNIPSDIIARSLELLSSDRIGWLEVVGEEDANRSKHGPNTDQIRSVSGPEPVLRGEEKREEKRECPNGHSPRMRPEGGPEIPAAPANDPERPESSEPTAPLARQAVPDCPYDAIATLYAEILVPPLPALRDGIPKAIREDVKRRWREHPDLAVFREVFQKVRDSDFLMGRVGDWQVPGLGWIVGPKNWAKIDADQYRNRDRPGPRAAAPSRLHQEFFEAEKADAERNQPTVAANLRLA